MSGSPNLLHRIEMLQLALGTEKATSDRLLQEVGVQAGAKVELQSQLTSAKWELQNLQNACAQRDRNHKVDTTYSYGRERASELATVIANNLESKPPGIDANRIFNCVTNIYRDWDRGYSDNPDFLDLDAHMLLAVCRASTWFSDRQSGKILEMLDSVHDRK